MFKVALTCFFALALARPMPEVDKANALLPSFEYSMDLLSSVDDAAARSLAASFRDSLQAAISKVKASGDDDYELSRDLGQMVDSWQVVRDFLVSRGQSKRDALAEQSQRIVRK